MKPYEPKNDGSTSDAIRSEIAHTRDDMDHTLDEIGQRITPRHLMEEVLGYFRSHRPDKEQVREKVKETTGRAMSKAGDAAGHVTHAVADAVRQHPIPSLLIGAGLAWAAYERQRQSHRADRFGVETGDHREGETGGEAYEEWGGEGSNFGNKTSDKKEDKMENVKDKISGGMQSTGEKFASAGEGIQQKGRELGRKVAERSRAVRDKAGELTHRVAEGAHRGYEVSREKFVQTSHEHPLTIGLGFLAAGLLAGLALPHSRKEDEWIGDTADRVKSRARSKGEEFVDRGKHVASAAVDAAKEAAAREGLTADSLKEKVRQVAEETKRAAEQTAEREKLQRPSV